MNCKNCGNPIEPPERYTEAGLDYCKEYDCLKACGEKIKGVAVVMSHKQGPMVVSLSSAVGQNFMDSSGHR